MPFPFTYREYINDANKCTTSGYYRGTSSNSNTPQKYGIMVVFEAQDYILQIYTYTTDSPRTWVRTSVDNGSTWLSWHNL